MSKGRSPWQDGRRAWQRLNGWHQDQPSAVPGHPDDGGSAVTALADIGLVRRLLDQAELVAVRTARRHGKSWAEIATKLGVTRQSAWERWRDLDDPDPAPGPDRPTGDAPHIAVGWVGEPPVAGEAPRPPFTEFLGPVAEELTEQSAHELRRRSTVRVPDLTGLSWTDACDTLRKKDLRALAADSDGIPLASTPAPDEVVTNQSPEYGAKIPAGSSVRLWLERRGGSGVREPRRPKPEPRSGRAMRDERSDEAVG